MNWKKTLKNVSFVILMLKICLVFGQKKIIVIDPGHGGNDSGAIGINGILEKDIAIQVAKEILNFNKTLFEDAYDVYLTRYKDTLISLRDRSRLAKSLDADVFISLHGNASRTQSKGMEVYIHASKTSWVLGTSILNETTGKLGLKKRGVKFANFQVLRETVAFCPSVLVELGFVSNKDEAYYFLSSRNIKAIALAVFIGIINYLKPGL
ncbi:N-acetylmuramoyl-L-alanine amidase family protein [Flaviramulus basaltis]|nr:N-acetylmuramoyl-L-alanine amidase [Flaviramulus basaltis]